MLIGERMSHPVITVHADLSLPDALEMMKREHKRHFPVVDSHGKLVGIVTEKDLIHASASNATSLSVWELNYLLNRITVEQVMSKDVITVTEDTPIEDAARIMADRKVGCLPVVREREVVGIITETDLFKMLLELFGARYGGVRLSVLIEDTPGKLHEFTEPIQSIGANIKSIGSFMGETSGTSGMVVKVAGASADAIRKAIEPYVIKILDIRETTGG
jgi:acetoin utilization protein AcuB